MKQRMYSIALLGLFLSAGLFVSCTKENKYGLDLTIQDEWAVIGPSALPPGAEVAYRTRYEEGNKYTWTVSDGATIVSGQGTYRIVLEVTGAPAAGFTVGVSVEGSSLKAGSLKVAVRTSYLSVSADLKRGGLLRTGALDTVLLSFNLPLAGGATALENATLKLFAGATKAKSVAVNNPAVTGTLKDGKAITYDKKNKVYQVPYVGGAAPLARFHLQIVGTKAKPLKAAVSVGGRSFAKNVDVLGDTLLNLITLDNTKPSASLTSVTASHTAIKSITDLCDKTAKSVDLGSAITTTIGIAFSEPISMIQLAEPCDKGVKPGTEKCNAKGQKLTEIARDKDNKPVYDVAWVYRPTISIHGVDNTDTKLHVKDAVIILNADHVTDGNAIAAKAVQIKVPLWSKHTDADPNGDSYKPATDGKAEGKHHRGTLYPVAKDPKNAAKCPNDDKIVKDGKAKPWSNSTGLFTVAKGTVNSYDIHVGYILRDVARGPADAKGIKDVANERNTHADDGETNLRLPAKISIQR